MSIIGKQPMRSMSFFQQREFKRVIRTYNKLCEKLFCHTKNVYLFAKWNENWIRYF